MSAPMATTLRRLSNLSLALSVPSNEDPIRQALQARADCLSNLVSWATIIVGVGVALELVEVVHDVSVWIKRKCLERRRRLVLKELAFVSPIGELQSKTETKSDEPIWVKLALRIGLIVVIAGVIGEWRYGAKLEDAHNDIHAYDVKKLTDAAKDAGDAKDSAAAVGALYKDLVNKHDKSEREIIELKAAKLPRRLSSKQKERFRKRVALLATKNIIVSCANGGTEAFDFAQDLSEVFFHPPLSFGGQYPFSCGEILGGGGIIRFSPIQVEAGADRQGDREILVKALVEIGINKKDIVTKTNENKALLTLTVGPKAP